MRRALLLLGAILLVGGVSFLAEIAASGASDSCRGCGTPAFAKIGGIASEVLLALWIMYAFVKLVRHFR